MPKQVLVADSTQINSFLECERLWNYTHRERLALREVRPSYSKQMGSYGHKLLEIYYRACANGCCSSEMAMKAALAFDFDNWMCDCGHSSSNHLPSPQASYCLNC